MMFSRPNWPIKVAAVAIATSSAAEAAVQVPLDRSDPGIAATAADDNATPAPDEESAPPPTLQTRPDERQNVQIPGIFAGAIRIEGARNTPMPELMEAALPFIGRRLSKDDLQALTKAVSTVAREHGYLFASSSVPVQTLEAGVLHVRLDEGQIDEVRIEGMRNASVEAMLSPMKGTAPTKSEIERRLMLADDLSGVEIGKVRFVREEERGVLIVPATRDKFAGRANIDNRGTSELGPVRMQLAVDFNGVIGSNDALTVQGTVTPLQPRELQVGFVRYALQVGTAGTELATYASYGRTHSGGYWRAFDANGESFIAGVSVTQPLIRGRKVSLWLSGSFDYYSVDQWTSGSPVRRDRLTTTSASLNGYAPMASGRLRAGIGITQGLSVLNSTQEGDPLASRIGADGQFTSFNAWANWTGDLFGPFSARLAAAGQLTSSPVLAINQIAIGGSYFGRAYDYSERAGDKGLLGSAELSAKVLDRNSGFIRWAQLYAFADAGEVDNLENSYGTGSLYSAGAGARLDFANRLSLGIEAAFPIDDVRYETGNMNPRISFSLGALF